MLVELQFILIQKLQKPQIVFPKFRNIEAVEMGSYLGDDFGVFYGDGKVLLANGFPVHTAELVHLVNQIADDGCIIQLTFIGTIDI